MKKILSILLALVSVISIAFAFGGCGDEEKGPGFFYTVEYAYSNGYITHDEAMSIAYYHNDGINSNTDESVENFTPQPLAPKKLSNKIEKSIKQTYLNTEYTGKISRSGEKLSDVKIDKYYGTYNGYVAVMVSGKYGPDKKVWTERFSDIEIRYKTANRIYIWRKADDPVNVRGKFYTPENAYENGWLNEGDLKSIACDYYDHYSYEENPYSGMFTSTEELTEEMEAEIKQAYLEQFVELPEGDRNRVKIYHCYGIYNGNVVIGIRSNYMIIDPVPPEDTDIGGVIFKDYWYSKFFIYHIN